MRLLVLTKSLLEDKIMAIRNRSWKTLQRFCEIDKTYFRRIVKPLITDFLLKKDVYVR